MRFTNPPCSNSSFPQHLYILYSDYNQNDIHVPSFCRSAASSSLVVAGDLNSYNLVDLTGHARLRSERGGGCSTGKKRHLLAVGLPKSSSIPSSTMQLVLFQCRFIYLGITLPNLRGSSHSVKAFNPNVWHGSASKMSVTCLKKSPYRTPDPPATSRSFINPRRPITPLCVPGSSPSQVTGGSDIEARILRFMYLLSTSRNLEIPGWHACGLSLG